VLNEPLWDTEPPYLPTLSVQRPHCCLLFPFATQGKGTMETWVWKQSCLRRDDPNGIVPFPEVCSIVHQWYCTLSSSSPLPDTAPTTVLLPKVLQASMRRAESAATEESVRNSVLAKALNAEVRPRSYVYVGRCTWESIWCFFYDAPLVTSHGLSMLCMLACAVCMSASAPMLPWCAQRHSWSPECHAENWGGSLAMFNLRSQSVIPSSSPEP